MGIKKPPGKFQLMEFNLIFILSVKGEVESGKSERIEMGICE